MGQREMAFPEIHLNSCYHLALSPYFALKACCSTGADSWWPDGELSWISNVVIGNRDAVGSWGRGRWLIQEKQPVLLGQPAAWGGIWGWDLDTSLSPIQISAAGTKWPGPCLSKPSRKRFLSSFVMWERLWRPRPSCLAAGCWDAISNHFSKWIGFQIDSLGNQIPLFVPQTGIACGLQAEAEHGVQGQLLIFYGLGWVWEGEGTCGEPRKMMSLTKN